MVFAGVFADDFWVARRGVVVFRLPLCASGWVWLAVPVTLGPMTQGLRGTDAVRAGAGRDSGQLGRESGFGGSGFDLVRFGWVYSGVFFGVIVLAWWWVV